MRKHVMSTSSAFCQTLFPPRGWGLGTRLCPCPCPCPCPRPQFPQFPPVSALSPLTRQGSSIITYATMDEKAKKARPSTLCVFFFQYSVTLIVMGTILYGGYYHCHSIPIPRSNDFYEKLLYAVRYSTFPQAVFLILAISRVAAKRAITQAAVDPLAGNEHLVQTEKNILTNTVEQLLVFLLLVLTLTTYLEPLEMRIIPLYSFTFFIGRVFFMIGYSFGPRYRGAGMYINACLGYFFLGYSIYLIYLRGFMYGVLTDSSNPTVNTGKSEL